MVRRRPRGDRHGTFVSSVGRPNDRRRWRVNDEFGTCFVDPCPTNTALIGHALFIGLFGLGAINAPMYVYVSQWFERRRGSALALIASGSYLAGTVWPPLFELSISRYGWRQTMMMYAAVLLFTAIPLALLFLERAPSDAHATTNSSTAAPKFRIRLRENVAFALLCMAAVLCCIPMSMPQQHLIAFCGDLGISRATGALFLSVLLGAAVAGRQIGGLAADKLGGLRTIFICSGIQALAMVGFIFTQDEAGLLFTAAVFGLGLSPIVPAYALTARELFDTQQAYWRIPTVLFCTGSGMALGGWFAGLLYDYFGAYAPAFGVGLTANIVNFMLIGILVSRQIPAMRTET